MATPVVAAMLSASARATDLYWDVNGATGDAVNTPGASATGVWDLITPNWNADPAGGPTPGTWVNDGTGIAFFSAGSNATGAFNANVADGVSLTVGGIVGQEGQVTIQRGGTGTAPTFTLSGNWEVASGLTNVLNIAVAGSGFTKTGNGTLSLSVKPAVPITVSAGQLFTSAALMPDVIHNNSAGTGTASGVGFSTTVGTYAGAIDGTGTITTASAAGGAAFTLNTFTGTSTFSGEARIRNVGHVLNGANGAMNGSQSINLRQSRLVLDNGAAVNANHAAHRQCRRRDRNRRIDLAFVPRPKLPDDQLQWRRHQVDRRVHAHRGRLAALPLQQRWQRGQVAAFFASHDHRPRHAVGDGPAQADG